MLEAGLGREALIVYIQKPFLGNHSFVYIKFYLYWLSGTDKRKNVQVLVAIRKDIFNKVIIKNYIDLVRHLYYIILDIKELNLVSENFSRKTNIINLYDNKVYNKCIWQRSNLII